MSTRLLFGGILTLALAYFWAQHLSASLFHSYHDWSGWRSITGGAPNPLTHGVEKVIWALTFCSGWWMLWRLDLFISNGPPPHLFKHGEETTPNTQTADYTEAKGKNTHFAHRSENFVPENENETKEDCRDQAREEQAPNQQKNVRKITFPTIEELQMAEVLNLSKEDLEDFAKIKATYRTAIAQYHPDKVSALGPEIREVAENKAKEINQAYEFFRKKFRDR